MTERCTVPRCFQASVARDLCGYHYSMRHRYPERDPDYIRPQKVTCQTCGVDVPVFRTGNIPRFCLDCRRLDANAKIRGRRHETNMRTYGLTPDGFAHITEMQHNRCAICGDKPTRGKGAANRRLSVDHDHNSGVIRGLLCAPCNAALGSFKDDPGILRAAADYVESRREWGAA